MRSDARGAQQRLGCLARLQRLIPRPLDVRHAQRALEEKLQLVGQLRRLCRAEALQRLTQVLGKSRLEGRRLAMDGMLAVMELGSGSYSHF